MHKRGDNIFKISGGIDNDNIKFKNMKTDYVVCNENIKQTAKEIDRIIKTEMGSKTIQMIRCKKILSRLINNKRRS